jgi:predicted transport protein
MTLNSAVDAARSAAEQLSSSGSGNEANTKALLIEPLLSALGWDFANLDEVDREVRVYDGTALDYALKLSGKARLFVEAKAVSKSLDDRQFIAQAVNYANNEGVLWCVLTNGLAYRVYKTNEPVGMAEKLLFEVDLTEADGAGGGFEELELISKKAVSEERLDLWGERVFTDTRVRQALASVASDPPSELVKRLEKLMGQPAVDVRRLNASLLRILGGASVAQPAQKGGLPTGAVKPPGKPKQEYPLDHHTAGKPAAIVDLFEQLDDFATSLGGDVTKRIRKFYVGYYAGSKERSFFTAEIQRQKVWLYLSLDPTQMQPWNQDFMRDVRNIGHYGMGDTEYVLRKPEQLDEAKSLVKKAYDRVH